MSKFVKKDSKSNNDCVFASLYSNFEIEPLHVNEIRKLITKIYMEKNRKIEAEEVIHKERKGNNGDINILSKKYNFKIKI